MNSPRHVGFAILAVPLMVPALAPAEPKAAHPNPVVECRVRFGSTDDGVALELRITEAALIRRLVEEPLAAAKADPERAEWIVLGTVSLRRKDGNGEGFVLFSPLGKIKQNGAYLVTNLSGLRPGREPKAPPDGMGLIVAVRGGPTPQKDASRAESVQVRSADGAGVEGVEVTIHLVSAYGIKPTRTDRAGVAVVNPSGARGISIRAGDIHLLLSPDSVRWPLLVALGPAAAPASGNSAGEARAHADTMTPILVARGGPAATPAGPSEQRVRVLNRHGKGIERTWVRVNDGSRNESEFRTDRTGVAAVKLGAGQVRSVSVHLPSVGNVTVSRDSLRWPLEVQVMTDMVRVE